MEGMCGGWVGGIVWGSEQLSAYKGSMPAAGRAPDRQTDRHTPTPTTL